MKGEYRVCPGDRSMLAVVISFGLAIALWSAAIVARSMR
jgi:hypothetical protein